MENKHAIAHINHQGPPVPLRKTIHRIQQVAVTTPSTMTSVRPFHNPSYFFADRDSDRTPDLPECVRSIVFFPRKASAPYMAHCNLHSNARIFSTPNRLSDCPPFGGVDSGSNWNRFSNTRAGPHYINLQPTSPVLSYWLIVLRVLIRLGLVMPVLILSIVNVLIWQ